MAQHGFLKWNMFRVILSASELWLRGGFASGDGSEKEEENDIESRICAAISHEEAEALGRSGYPSGAAEKGESADTHQCQHHHAAVLERGG